MNAQKTKWNVVREGRIHLPPVAPVIVAGPYDDLQEALDEAGRQWDAETKPLGEREFVYVVAEASENK